MSAELGEAGGENLIAQYKLVTSRLYMDAHFGGVRAGKTDNLDSKATERCTGVARQSASRPARYVSVFQRRHAS